MPAEAQNDVPVSHKFAKNAFFNVAGFVVTFPILILLTPYILEVLGKAKFGVWALAGVVTSYAQLSDMGMTTALVKFVAEHWIKRDVDKISKIVSTAFFSFAVIGGLVAGGIFLARHFIVVSLLKVPPELQSEALFVVSGVVVIFYFNLLFSVYNSVLQGLQRMDVTNGIMVVSKVLRAGGMYYFLATGFGLKGLIINSAVFSALTVGANVFWAKRLTAELKVNPFWYSFSELRGIVKYSANIFAAKLLGLAQDPINKIILAAYTSLPFVAFYEVGWRVNSMVRQLFGMGLTPLLPASSELQSISSKQELERMYLSISRMLYIFAVPVFLLIIVMAEPLMQVWLGDGYKFAARSLQFLLLGNLFSLLVTPQYIILQGIGKPQINTQVHAIAAGINLVLAIVLVQYIGFYGVLVGGAASLFAASVYTDFLFRRAVGINLRVYLQQISVLSISGSVVLCGTLLTYTLRLVNIWSFGSLMLFAFGFFLLYFAILRFAGITNSKDKQLVIRLIKAVNVGINHR